MTYDRTNREEKTLALIKNDIESMKESSALGDNDFLSSVLSGEGWIPYSQLDDAALDEAYYEMIDAGKVFLTCSICDDDIEHKKQGSIIWADGNNAQPVNAGRCCDSCDCRVVVVTRMGINPNSKHGKAIGDMMYEMRIGNQQFVEEKEQEEE
tara:strand:- start:63 stop:521 length:459 start_codon:yes stop_codon:yes gene_type:complete